MKEVIEIKIKEEGVIWEKTLVIKKVAVRDRAEAYNVCLAIAGVIGKEVRWNWAGDWQGHYCPPQID